MSDSGASAEAARGQARRELKFDQLEEIYQDAERLLEGGYASVGDWNLAQVCGHVQQWMSFPMDGFPKPGFPINGMMWVMKILVGRSMLKKVLAEGKMKAKAPTMPSTVPSADGDDAVAVQRLRETVERLIGWKDDYYASPLFGPMDRETVVRLQLIHAAHHLSFLIPNEGGDY
jgi:hypothetical protein